MGIKEVDGMDTTEMLIVCISLFAMILMGGLQLIILWLQRNQINKAVETLRAMFPELITLVEEDGYISPRVKSTIIEKLGDNFHEIEIDGTLEPVRIGETVYLILSVAKRNVNGGYFFKKRFVLKGIAQ